MFLSLFVPGIFFNIMKSTLLCVILPLPGMNGAAVIHSGYGFRNPYLWAICIHGVPEECSHFLFQDALFRPIY